MALYLLSGTPGQAKAGAAEKIARCLREAGIAVGAVANVEDELLDLLPEYKSKSISNQEPRVALIGERAQDEIKDKWPAAYKNAVEKATSGSPEVAIVLLCFEYYRFETFEFYSPVDCNAIKETKPSSILTLIDDVFDVYFRLSRPGQVFDIQALIERAFPIAASGSRNRSDMRRLYKDALQVVIGSLLRVLTWREKEIECAANVSRTVSCGNAILAAKHPVEAGARLLLGSASLGTSPLGVSYPVYVSHPISRPRRERLKTGEWPEFVNHLDGVVAGLSGEPVNNCRIVPVMPTAIDEFRILDDGTYLHPALTPRWRLQQGELLFSLPTPLKNTKKFDDYEDYGSRGLSMIFDPPIDSSGRRVGLPLSDPEVSGMMRNLREAIKLQMAGRDHMLVRQCPGFFLYRPLYGEFEFSGGVASEIHTFDQIRKYSSTIAEGAKRHVAFIHDTADAVGLFAKADDRFPDPVHQASAALSTAANEMVNESNVKTKRPSAPKDETVAKALQAPGDPEAEAHSIHDEMFPQPSAQSIGAEEPFRWEVTRDRLKETIASERVTALSSDIGHDVLYTFSKDEPVWKHTQGGDKPDTYVDVVKGLDNSESRRTAAADRARRFFASSISSDAQDDADAN